jgi:hypothetical protein
MIRHIRTQDAKTCRPMQKGRIMHDQNFKNLILDYPVQALEFFAEKEAGSDLSEARIIPIRQATSKACHPPDIMTATISLRD